MEVLALTKYSQSGASSRLRTYQYINDLKQGGITLNISPLLSDKYVEDLQRGKKNYLEVLKGYIKRVFIVLFKRKVDFLWIEYEVFPWLPYFLENFLILRNKNYALDYDDAVFHSYDKSSSLLIRTLLGKKHNHLMRNSNFVSAGNEYLASKAKDFGSEKVEIIPTVVDLKKYSNPSLKNKLENSRPMKVCWIGQRLTAKYLEPLNDLFSKLSQRGIAEFTCIGPDPEKLGLNMKFEPWSESNEVELISKFDLGIMPLVDGYFERGKCGYKIIQYFACSLPVIASPVGVNSSIVDHKENGYLADSIEEWESFILELSNNPDLRIRMGKKGRMKVESCFSLQITSIELLRAFKSALS